MIASGYIFATLYVAVCILLALILYKLGLPKPYTRKVVHVLVGAEWLILYHHMKDSPIHFLIVCAVFTALLAIDYKLKLLKPMSSDSSNAPGTVYYGLSMTVMAAVSVFVSEAFIPFGIAVFCTSLGDGFAGVVGQSIKKHNPTLYNSKSLLGTLTNFVVCTAVVIAFNHIYSLGLDPVGMLSIAFFATEIELVSKYGLDNILLSLGVFALTLFITEYPDAMNYIIPILFTPIIIEFVTVRKSLTTGGVIAAAVADLIVSVSLGNLGFTILISFFVFGIITDKYKETANKTEQKPKSTKKGRTVVQVLANSGTALVAAILWFITKRQIFLIAYVAVMAEALSDTSASGIGSSAKTVFDPFRWKRVANGTSGGMSVLGTVAGLVGASVISAIALLFGALSLKEALFTAAVAFLGMLFDSLLGSLLQGKYTCPICGKAVEKPIHCETKTHLYSGLSFVNNSTVNFLSTVFAFALSLTGLIIL